MLYFIRWELLWTATSTMEALQDSEMVYLLCKFHSCAYNHWLHGYSVCFKIFKINYLVTSNVRFGTVKCFHKSRHVVKAIEKFGPFTMAPLVGNKSFVLLIFQMYSNNYVLSKLLWRIMSVQYTIFKAYKQLFSSGGFLCVNQQKLYLSLFIQMYCYFV